MEKTGGIQRLSDMLKSVSREKWCVVNTVMINETYHNLTKVTGIKPHGPDKKAGMTSSKKKSIGM